MTTMTKAAADVLAERQRQISAEGWTHEHDDGHEQGELSLAGALYALPYATGMLCQDDYIGLQTALYLRCGWDLKPEEDARKRLVKGAALILAEIERFDRRVTDDHGPRHEGTEKGLSVF